jgi:hypothetical protein
MGAGARQITLDGELKRVRALMRPSSASSKPSDDEKSDAWGFITKAVETARKGKLPATLRAFA